MRYDFTTKTFVPTTDTLTWNGSAWVWTNRTAPAVNPALMHTAPRTAAQRKLTGYVKPWDA